MAPKASSLSGVVAGCVKEAVEFADIGGAESVIVVYDDIESDGGEGGGQGVGSWETHFCSWKFKCLQSMRF